MASKKAKKETVSGDMPTPMGDRLELLRDLYPEAFLSEEFKSLWERIKHKTR